MLTIENYERLKGKVIGNTGYYVDKIESVMLVFSNEPNSHFYHIELANRKSYIIVRLDRTGFGTGKELKLYELKLGQNYINLTKYQLRNMDLVINNINKLVLGQYI